MIERTTRETMYKLLEDNSNWNIVDLASSNSGWKYANVFTYNQKYCLFVNK